MCVCKCKRERQRGGKQRGMEVAELKGPSWGKRQGEWASQGEVVQGGVGLVGVTEPGEGVRRPEVKQYRMGLNTER